MLLVLVFWFWDWLGVDMGKMKIKMSSSDIFPKPPAKANFRTDTEKQNASFALRVPLDVYLDPPTTGAF